MLKSIIKELIMEDFKTVDKKPIQKKSIGSGFIGLTVMIRTYSAGVHFGVLMSIEDDKVILTDSRRVYSWVGAMTLSQLSMEGSNNIKDCKIAMPLDHILLQGVIEVIPMTDASVSNLKGAIHWKK